MTSGISPRINFFEYKHTLPKHLDISSRMVSYWKSKKILPFFEDGKNGKMNIPQAVWLFLVQELSEFGINSKRLERLAYLLWQKPYEDSYLKNKIESEIANLEKNFIEEGSIKKLKIIINDPMLLRTLSQEITPFSDSVIDCIVNDKQPLSFYYFLKSDECFIRNDNKAISERLISMTNNEPYLCIPLMPFISEVISVEMNHIKKDLTYLSQVENQIREIILSKSPKYVEILIDNDNIKPLIIRDSHKNAKQLADFFLNNKLPRTARLLIEPRAQDNYKLTILTK